VVVLRLGRHRREVGGSALKNKVGENRFLVGSVVFASKMMRKLCFWSSYFRVKTVIFRLFLLKNGIFSKKNVFFLFCLQLVTFQRFTLLFFALFFPSLSFFLFFFTP
jgi:hypothetical protein